MTRTLPYKILRPVLTLVLLVVGVALWGQSVKETMLRKQLAEATSDTAKARLSGELAWELKFVNNNEAFELASEELKLAPNDALRLADAYRTQALVRVIDNRIAEGLDLYELALLNARKAKSSIYEASCYSLMAGLYQDKGDYDRALHYYLEGLKVAERAGETRMMGTLYNNIASVYGSAGYIPQQALEYYNKALQQATKLNNNAFAGLITGNMAGEYLRDGKKDSAELLAQRSLDYASQSGTHGYEYAVALTNVGDIYRQLNKTNEAESYLKEAIAIQDSLKRPINVLGPIAILCNLYLQQNNIAAAEPFAKRLLNMAIAYNTKPFIREGYKVLSEVAKKRNQPALALQYYEQYSAWSDSVFNDSREQSIANVQSRAEMDKHELEVQYETKKKTQENKILSLQNYTLRFGVLLGVLAVLLLALVVFLVVRANKLKEKTNRELEEKNKRIEQQNKEKDTLMQEIHHRVKNNLQIVSSLLNLQANALTDQAAKDALRESHNRVRSISLIHQKLYMQDDLSAISLEEYVLQLGNHLKHVFNAHQIEITCSVYPPSVKLDMQTSIPLGVILNELITNAIKYAQINRPGGQIHISFTDDLGGLCTLQFTDNGIGMPEGFEVRKSPTLGLRMVNELTRQLQGTLTYSSIPQPTFTITFPTWRK